MDDSASDDESTKSGPSSPVAANQNDSDKDNSASDDDDDDIKGKNYTFWKTSTAVTKKAPEYLLCF